jgi:MFS family permease
MSFFVIFLERKEGKCMEENKLYKFNLILVKIETILTSISAAFSVPIITLFWNSIGMDQAAIGFVQMIFTIVILFLDVPMGYIADRFNRKVVNIIGDFGCAFAFAFYMFAKNMYMAIIAECLLGIFLAMTNGVDYAFIKYNSDKIDETGKLFKKNIAQLEKYKFIAIIVAMIIGMIVSRYSLRLTIGISSIPYFIGGFFALFITNIGEKSKVIHKNPFKDMGHNIKEIMKTKKIKWYVLAYMFAKEITHPVIWVFTPLMILVGVPAHVVAIGWIFNYIFATVGSHIAEKTVNLKFSTKFAIPIIACLSWTSILIIDVNIVTVWLFALNGLAQGMTSGSIIPSIQSEIKDEFQTTVISISSTAARLFYVPLVFFLNLIANNKPQMALVGNLIIFLPLSLMTFIQLRRLENKVM